MRITIVPFVPTGEVQTVDKLNVTIPYERTIELVSADILDVCVNVIEYVPGPNSNVLNLGFDNGDASSFNTNNNLVFDGVMKVKTSFVYSITEDAGTPSVYESDPVTIADFVTIDSLVFATDLTVTAYPGGQTATPTNYIDLSGIEKMNSITVVANQGAGTVLRYAIDFGSGLVAWNGSVWVSVSNIATEGMTLATINALTSEQLEAGRSNSTQFKVIYYVDPTDSTSTANNDSIVVEVELLGTTAFSTDYTLSFNDLTNEVTVTFTKNGTYRINYVGGV